jgi:hypothetical protein
MCSIFYPPTASNKRSLNLSMTLSYSPLNLETLLRQIVASPELHAKWLNTLSFLENCGARKIAACEHPTLVKEQMLKHAAEEFRHAHHLKKQISRIWPQPLTTYSPNSLLGHISTLHYLHALDLKTCRYLKDLKLCSTAIKEAAYLLVTYAIECRAEILYPIYDRILRQTHSRVMVKSILLEEKEHLEEMRTGIVLLPSGVIHAEKVCSLETTLYHSWLDSIHKCINTSYAIDLFQN